MNSRSSVASGHPIGRIETLDPLDPGQVEAIARLHGALIPSSPVARMGHFFMTKFYYRFLPASGLIHCDLFKYGDHEIAFSVYTEYPLTFMSEGRRRHWTPLLCVLLIAVLVRPTRIALLLKMVSLSGRRTHAQNFSEEARELGEYLSMAVDARYADRVEAASGLRVTESLWARAVNGLKAKRMKRMMMVVEKSNFLAMRFHESRGAKKTPSDFIPESCCQLVLDL